MGAEGPTDDPEIITARERQKRNLLATLFLSQGVPMLCGGDEIGRTQQRQQQRLLPGQRDQLVRLEPRRAPARSCWNLRGKLIAFAQGPSQPAAPQVFPGSRGLSLVARRTSPGTHRWRGDDAGAVEHRLDAQHGSDVQRHTLDEVDEMGEPIMDDSFLILLNSYAEGVTYTLPQSPLNRGWKLLMNTDDLDQPFRDVPMDGALDVAGRSILLLRELAPEESKQPDAAAKEALEPMQAELDPVPAEPVLASAQREESRQPDPEHAAADELPAEPIPVMAEPLPGE